MSSIINAYRNIISDNSWFLKTVIMSIPIFMVLNFVMEKTNGIDEKTFALFVAILVLYLGTGTHIMNRNINNNAPILPNILELPELLFHSFFSIIVALPGGALCLVAIKLINTYFSFDFKTMCCLYAITIILFCPFIFIPLCLYSMNRKIAEAFNLKPLIDGGGNFIVSIFSFIVQYIFTFAIVWALLYIVFSQMMSDNIIVNIIHSFFIVLTFLTLFSYISDQFGDSIPDPRTSKELYF